MPSKLQIPASIDLNAFVSKEAHDLKSPFNRSLGFLKLVLKGMDGPISEQAQEDLTVAYQNIQYTLAMMSALVDVARLERGERAPTPDAHPVDGLLQRTISDWTRKYYKDNPVEIHVTSPNVSIVVDEIMIRQCFAYWISYINEFVQGASTIHIQVKAETDHCLFTLRSNGDKVPLPPESDLALWGAAAKGFLDLHHGEVTQLEAHEQGAVGQFKLPKA